MNRSAMPARITEVDVLRGFALFGIVLLTYAVVGIVVLLPASFLPGRRLILVLGGVATAVAAVAAGGGMLVPGLFLVGFGAARYGVEKLLDLPTDRIRIVSGVAAVLAVTLNVLQIGQGADPDSLSATVAGLATAAAYVTAIMLLMRSRIRRAPCTLAPLGRTALTSYIAATPLILTAGHLLHIGDESNYVVAFAVGAGVFLVEVAFSLLWLRRARYGPLEWVWRRLTWWQVVSLAVCGPPCRSRSCAPSAESCGAAARSWRRRGLGVESRGEDAVKG